MSAIFSYRCVCYFLLSLLLLFPPVVAWRQSRMLFEESAESRRVGEVEQVGDLLNALVGVVHEEYATSDDGPEDMLLYGKS